MNIFEYAAREESLFESMLADITDYERKTTFYSDLSIAEVYGVSSIKETFDRVIESWMDNIEYITEFAMCLNYKSWEHNSRHKEELTEVYSDLYYKAYDMIVEHYKDNEKELSYFFRTLD